MRQATAAFCAAVGLCLASQAMGRAEELVLAEGGQSAYRIVVADNASPSTRHGAEELQIFLEQMTGAKLPIISDQQPLGPREIILGENAHLAKMNSKFDFQALGNEGYVIRTVGPHLVIAGGALRGNMYGVYGLLEDHLGCRWFAAGVSRIPILSLLAISAGAQPADLWTLAKSKKDVHVFSTLFNAQNVRDLLSTDAEYGPSTVGTGLQARAVDTYPDLLRDARMAGDGP